MATKQTAVPKTSREATPQPVAAVSNDSAVEAVASPQHRTQAPAFPQLVGPNAQAAAQRILAVASATQRGNKASFDQAAKLIANISVKNLTPYVAVYKAEMIDFLEGQAK